MWQQPKTLAPPPLDWVSLSSVFIYLLARRSILARTNTQISYISTESIKTFLWPAFLTRGPFYLILRLEFFLWCLNPLNERGNIGNLEAGKNTQIVCSREEEKETRNSREVLKAQLSIWGQLECLIPTWVWTKLNLDNSSWLQCSVPDIKVIAKI